MKKAKRSQKPSLNDLSNSTLQISTFLPCIPIFQAGRYPRTKGTEDFTHSILYQILSENHYEMSIFLI